MSEVNNYVSHVSKTVYSLYTNRKRLSPFFEHYVKREKIRYGNGGLEQLENELIEQLLSEYKSWPTYSP